MKFINFTIHDHLCRSQTLIFSLLSTLTIYLSGGGLLFAQTSGGNADITHTIEVKVVKDPQKDTARVKLGIGEKVKLKLSGPDDHKADWTIEGGNGTFEGTSTNVHEVTYVAPDTACKDVKITAKCNKQNSQVTEMDPKFEVIKPSGVVFDKIKDTSSSNPFQASMEALDIYITPADVNFEAIEAREGMAIATADGYFEDLDGEPHPPTPSWRGMLSHAAGKGTLFNGGDLVGPDPAGGGFPGPYIDGNFEWKIDWKYKCNSSEGEICKLDQVLTMKVSTDTNPTTLTATASKGGQEVKATKTLP